MGNCRASALPKKPSLIDDGNFFGNGQGFFTESSSFGLPAGGQRDDRMQFYFGDSWKVRPYLTLTAGIRYVRDTGRTDSDLDPIPCSALDATLAPDPARGRFEPFCLLAITPGRAPRDRSRTAP